MFRCLFAVFLVLGGFGLPQSLADWPDIPSDRVTFPPMYFSDRQGRFHVELSGWTSAPGAPRFDDSARFRYESGDEATLSVVTDARIVGDPFIDASDRYETLKPLIAGLGWRDTRIVAQRVIKVGARRGLDVVVLGYNRRCFRCRFVLIEQGGNVHQLRFITLSSEYLWLRPAMNRVIDSFRPGPPPSQLMVSEP